MQKIQRQREVSLTIMISIIVLVFVVCNSFESLLFILQSQKLLSGNLVQDFLRPMADFLMVFNSGVNVIIYCAFNPGFREKFFEVYFNCCKKMKSDVSSTMISITQKPRKTTQQTNISEQMLQETSL